MLIRWKNKIRSFLIASNRPVFFIHITDSAEAITSFIQSLYNHIKKETLFICFNSKVPYYYENLNFNFKILDDYLSVEDYESMDNFIYDVTRKWYRHHKFNKKGITEYKGIHLGSIVEYDFQLFLIRRLKWFVGMYKVISAENPDKIIILEDTGELLKPIELIREICHIPLLRLYNKVISKDSYSLKQNFKPIFVDIITSIIDCFVRLRLKSNIKDKVIMDKRVWDDLKINLKLPDNFMATPFEKGLRLRIGLIRKGLNYFPFYFPSNFRIGIKKIFFFNPKNLKKNCYYNDLSVWKLFAGKIRDYYVSYFPLIQKNIKLLEKFFNRNSIKAIILRHDLWELQRTCVEAAKKFNVPTVVVQHGVFGEKGEEIIFADKIAVWGNLCRDIYKSFGNDPNRCCVTGNPRLDQFFNPRPKLSREETHDILNLDKDKKTIVLISGVFKNFLSTYMNGDEYDVIISEVLKVMRRLTNYQLIIKLHPYESFEFTNRAIKYYKSNNVRVVKNFDNLSLINASDLILTKRSTLGLKAMVLNKPIIVINFEKRPEVNPYVRAKVALEVNKSTDIYTAILSTLEDYKVIDELRTKSRMFVQDYAYKIDGCSSKRVLDFIKEVVANNKKINQSA